MTELGGRITSLTPAQQGLLRQELGKRKLAQQERVIPPRGREGPALLSFAQERLWFLEQLEPGSAVHNIPFGLRLKGALNIPVLKRCLDEIVRRHEALRTHFESVEGQARQIVEPKGPLEVPVIDLNTLPEQEREAEAMRLCKEEVQRPFDLSKAPTLRARLIRLNPEECILALTMHHIASDGWSMAVLVRELNSLYGAFCEGKPSPLPELAIQYADYAAWQREWLQGEVLERQLSYWKKRLAGAPQVLELPADRPRPVKQSYRGGYVSSELPGGLSRALAELGRRERVTLFMTLLAAFQALLHRYTAAEDVLVGTASASRNRPELENLIGFFVNTLVLRGDLSGNPSFRELIRRTRQSALEAQMHQDLPFETLVGAVQPQRDMSHSPLFQVMFVFQNAPRESLQLPGLQASPIRFATETSKFDLTLAAVEQGGQLRLGAEYNADLFDAGTIQRMLGHYQRLLEGIVANPDQRLSDFPLLTSAERQQLLVGWNPDHADNCLDGCIHQLFEKQVERNPEAVAAVFENEKLTYRELNQRSNQLAHALRRMGVGPETLVGVYTERSLEMVIGILGILKAGGAYLPLDPVYPRERLAFMLEDARPRAVLTQQRLLGSLPKIGGTILPLDGDRELLCNESVTNPVSGVSLDHLAYVIYTSGSTGKPKGTLVTHRNVARLFQATEEWFRFGAEDVWTLFHSPAFDFSVWELWGALAYGAKLVVVPYWVSRSPDVFYELLCNERVTVLNQTPSAFRQLIQAEQGARKTLPMALRFVIFGGEALEMGSLKPWFDRHGDHCPQLVNMYGITETTVHVTYRPVTGADVNSESVIGIPISDLKVYILDCNRQLAPIGVPGELCVGGAGVARGYLNRPELTAERFLVNPFTTKQGDRLYRSGDLARYLPSGDLEYLGRIDYQVKIRGFRIELGEIESVLAGLPGVREAVVLVREDVPGNKRLAAYLTAKEGEPPKVSELRDLLRAKLPEYMVPSAFVTLERFLLTPNGKVDRTALPRPDLARPELEEGFVAPCTPTEEALARIWCEILGLRQVGIHDNFFELGGHSLLAVRLQARIEKELGQRLPLAAFFQAPTVRGLAMMLADSKAPSHGLYMSIPASLGPSPLFYLHFLSQAQRLAKRLGSKWPVYGLAAPYDEELRLWHEHHKLVISIEELAARCLPMIQRVQPKGPYRLAGGCFGGVLAFEIARELRRLGEEIGLLALVDAFYSPGCRRLRFSQVRRWVYHGGRILRGEVNYALTKWRRRRELAAKRRRQLEQIRNNHDPSAGDEAERLRLPQAEFMGQLLRRYAAEPYAGSAVLIRGGADPLFGIDPGPANGWQAVIQGNLSVETLNCGHMDISEEPHISEVARRLEKYLLKADPGLPSASFSFEKRI